MSAWLVFPDRQLIFKDSFASMSYMYTDYTLVIGGHQSP